MEGADKRWRHMAKEHYADFDPLDRPRGTTGTQDAHPLALTSFNGFVRVIPHMMLLIRKGMARNQSFRLIVANNIVELLHGSENPWYILNSVETPIKTNQRQVRHLS